MLLAKLHARMQLRCAAETDACPMTRRARPSFEAEGCVPQIPATCSQIQPVLGLARTAQNWEQSLRQRFRQKPHRRCEPTQFWLRNHRRRCARQRVPRHSSLLTRLLQATSCSQQATPRNHQSQRKPRRQEEMPPRQAKTTWPTKQGPPRNGKPPIEYQSVEEGSVRRSETAPGEQHPESVASHAQGAKREPRKSTPRWVRRAPAAQPMQSSSLEVRRGVVLEGRVWTLRSRCTRPTAWPSTPSGCELGSFRAL
mmetsp:Transcript_11507/g.30270  ORF Transcript_11507/g.30270 Transcript_11507/m.30270 type:complete len:254 (-) Transcript_11507:39-800(-)